MILTGKEIKREIERGYIDIQPFNEKQLNPNSYNLRLADELLIYERNETVPNIINGNFIRTITRPSLLDMKKDNPYRILKIPEEGFVLEPGTIYLGRTMEWTRTDCYVPMLEGRSSVGRLGISIHETAGFGDVGFKGYWTLELSCIQPVRIYAEVEICQIYYHTILKGTLGEELITYKDGKYQDNKGIQPSMMWKEFNKE